MNPSQSMLGTIQKQLASIIAVIVTATSFAFAFQPAPAAQSVPQQDSSFIDSNGTAHIARVVPVPTTISPEAQEFLKRPMPDLRGMTVEQRRQQADILQAARGAKFRAMYPVHIDRDTIAGVPVRVIAPLSMPKENRNRVLINLHDSLDTDSLAETIPIADLAKMKVVAVLYRLGPEHPFPAAVDDAIAVYRQTLKTYTPRHVCLYGTSAGAILESEVAVKMRQLGLPLPGCLGIFAGTGDSTQRGDSQSMFGLFGLSGPIRTPRVNPTDAQRHGAANSNMKAANPKDLVRSPIYSDLQGYPPTLFITSERDMLLSGTINLHRAFLRAGVDARLVVFEGLPHAFWNHPGLPETKEADEIMASFFARQLGR